MDRELFSNSQPIKCLLIRAGVMHDHRAPCRHIHGLLDGDFEGAGWALNVTGVRHDEEIFGKIVGNQLGIACSSGTDNRYCQRAGKLIAVADLSISDCIRPTFESGESVSRKT